MCIAIFELLFQALQVEPGENEKLARRSRSRTPDKIIPVLKNLFKKAFKSVALGIVKNRGGRIFLNDFPLIHEYDA